MKSFLLKTHLIQVGLCIVAWVYGIRNRKMGLSMASNICLKDIIWIVFWNSMLVNSHYLAAGFIEEGL